MHEYLKKTYKDTVDSFNNLIFKNLINEKKTFIVTANPETFNCGEKDEEFNKILLDKNTVIIPDGISIVNAGKILGYDIKERITGIDTAEFLLKTASENNKKVYLFGSKQEVLNKLESVIKKRYNGINLVGMTNGYVKNKDEDFIRIKKFNPDIVLVALGIPEQEKLIYRHIDKFDKGIFVGVGGSLDVISGTKKRAPTLFIKLNLEWLYRIISEPKRLKRFYQNNIKFLFKVRKLKKR